jgi:hypothetical protein
MVKENNWKVRHLLLGFPIGALISYMLLFFPYNGNKSAPMLIIFNFLFISLIFPLNGPLKAKIFLLLMGNAIGFLWNNLFWLFAHHVVDFLGEPFNTLHMILSPMINLIWIVSFWSISLTVLAHSKTKKEDNKLVN